LDAVFVEAGLQLVLLFTVTVDIEDGGGGGGGGGAAAAAMGVDGETAATTAAA